MRRRLPCAAVYAVGRTAEGHGKCLSWNLPPIEMNGLPASPTPTRAPNGRTLDAITLVILPLPSRRSHTCRHDPTDCDFFVTRPCNQVGSLDLIFLVPSAAEPIGHAISTAGI
jgi:hypothetical protein